MTDAIHGRLSPRLSPTVKGPADRRHVHFACSPIVAWVGREAEKLRAQLHEALHCLSCMRTQRRACRSLSVALCWRRQTCGQPGASMAICASGALLGCRYPLCPLQVDAQRAVNLAQQEMPSRAPVSRRVLAGLRHAVRGEPCCSALSEEWGS